MSDIPIAKVIADSINSAEEKKLADMRSKYKQNFIDGCVLLRQIDNSSWKLGTSFRHNEIIFNRDNNQSYSVYCPSWLIEEANNQMTKFCKDGFEARVEENQLTIINPFLAISYEASEGKLHGCLYSSEKGLNFVIRAIDEYSKLGIKRIDIYGLRGDGFAEIIEYLGSKGYSIPKNGQISFGKISAINPYGEYRLAAVIKVTGRNMV